ncbi:hypothetical protein D3227_27250 [Mesorhizobium waimense]|uniref:Uncharacterized protein n=1 Tax=Mesorhizobium waimense TaxID=1300307 RepID=A0A3A5KHB2_9HYPH|nr:hypothetical protein [Mesorhizobium waimense]RJT32100.1 hypothetical protein D3227_27250 [Mesorhizobium waimense]
MKDVLPYISIVSSLVAAGLGFRAAKVEIRNSIDDFMDDIQRQGRWAGYAAIAAWLAVVLQGIDRLAG